MKDDLLGEYVWLKSPLDEICHCLPLAKSENQNEETELLESDEQGCTVVNAVVTRSKQKIFPEKEKRGERRGA
ncbi:hypothetical protein TNCV_1920631 [Trichonephila clavipes]|nr:hypothetical protein TNCV_1920631 [Trichonephila clavipes]